MTVYWFTIFIYIFFMAGVIYFDLRYYKIPNWLTLPAIAFFLLICILKRFELTDILARIASTAGLLLLSGLATSFFLKKEAIGGGDIKLVLAIGLYKGWEDGLLIIFFGAFSALSSIMVSTALKKRTIEEPIPFGFFIALCGILFQGYEIINKIV